MTAVVHEFKSVAQEEQESAIEVLEEVLAEAKAGKVQSVSIGVVRPGGAVASHWSQGNVTDLIAACAITQHRITVNILPDFDQDG